MKNGGPAFPLKEPLSCDSEGMSLRDHFAAKALQGILSNPEHNPFHTFGISYKRYSEISYGLADAMLAEREKEGNQ